MPSFGLLPTQRADPLEASVPWQTLGLGCPACLAQLPYLCLLDLHGLSSAFSLNVRFQGSPNPKTENHHNSLSEPLF